MTSVTFIIENINRKAGTEKATLDLAELLHVYYGFRISIISVSSSVAEKHFANYIKVYHLNVHSRFLNKIKILRKSVEQILNKEQSDYFISTGHNFSCLILPVFAKKVKTVAVEHISAKLVEPYYRFAQCVFYSKLYKIVVLTPDQIKKYSFVKDKTICIPNSIKQIIVDRKPEHMIFAAGRLEKVKGFDLLIDSLAKIKNEINGYEIRICGDGVQREILQKQIDDNGLEEIVKLLPNHDLYEEWQKAMLFILSSRSESFGLAAAEAASAGIPCIVFNSSGPKYIFNDTKTVLIEQNSEILAERIVEFISDSKLREENIIECRKAIERFLPEKIVLQWRENVFNK